LLIPSTHPDLTICLSLNLIPSMTGVTKLLGYAHLALPIAVPPLLKLRASNATLTSL
jgi:hypothetical protein